MEFFIDAKHEVVDDLLFFVRQYVPSHKSSTGSINDQDPVLVKRRVAGQTPALTDVIDWKQSFFLNLISQLPCTLTVSICTRSNSEETRASNGELQKKNTMIASKRITRKVFAAPYKSRMDVKDALMNECSYPLVYYTVNDFETDSLHLQIAPGEYLCAELSVTIPNESSSEAYIKATELVSKITLEEDSDPFPLPRDHQKVILFQGAVPFKALSDVYMQKGVAAAHQVKQGWGRLADPNSAGTRTEYILMRGPQGKGQCQEQPQNASIYGFLKTVVKSQFVQESIPVQPPEVLDCSMTYVNVPWQSIACDLIDHHVNSTAK
ncbi:hypothetical protein HDV01_006812 [Terramyces sp. JEL0728]|nr:hypothetical protein HDV01_006812 [Terramyces sp. JEL0728]